MNTKRGSRPPAKVSTKGLQVIHRRSGGDRRAVASRGGRRSSEKIATRRPQINIAVLEESFTTLASRGDELAQRFYQRLFELRPAVRPLFAAVDVVVQQKKLLNALVLMIRNLRNPAVLAQTMKGLGARHKQYGVQPEDYPAVRAALLEVMAALAGKAWTPAVAMAWEDALYILTDVMQKAYRNQKDQDIP